MNHTVFSWSRGVYNVDLGDGEDKKQITVSQTDYSRLCQYFLLINNILKKQNLNACHLIMWGLVRKRQCIFFLTHLKGRYVLTCIVYVCLQISGNRLSAGHKTDSVPRSPKSKEKTTQCVHCWAALGGAHSAKKTQFCSCTSI